MPMQLLPERVRAVLEELNEVESLNELRRTWCHWESEAPECAHDPVCMGALKRALHRPGLCRMSLRALEDEKFAPKPVETPQAQPQSPQPARPPVQRVPGRVKYYKLLNTDVSWTGKPQVHALMQILSAHAQPGDILAETDIIAMMEANEALLNTCQGARRIWKYYRGKHMDGLELHGNIEEYRG